MKKALLFLSITVLIISLAACGNGKDNTANDSGKGSEIKTSENAFTIDGDTIELDYERNHRDLFYKENVSDLNSSTMGSFRDIAYRKDGESVFEIYLVYYQNKSIEEVMRESDYSISDKTVNGLSYKFFEFNNNGVPGHTYVYCYNGTTYTISFVSQHDMTSLEKVFMNTVRFETAQ